MTTTEITPAWTKLPPIEAHYGGCLNCSPRPATFPPEGVIAVGFGYAALHKDGAPVWSEDEAVSDNSMMTGAYQMALAHLQARGEQFLEMQDALNKRDDELLKQAALVVDLRAQLETLQREAMRGASCLSGQDRYTAAGYLVRASKRKPRTLLDKDKARDAELSSIRAGAQRAEVFALVPIGHARRGAEWMPS